MLIGVPLETAPGETRVAVTPEGMTALGPRQLQPGMPAEVIIKTGERTFMDYLLAPIGRRIFNSFREA